MLMVSPKLGKIGFRKFDLASRANGESGKLQPIRDAAPDSTLLLDDGFDGGRHAVMEKRECSFLKERKLIGRDFSLRRRGRLAS